MQPRQILGALVVVAALASAGSSLATILFAGAEDTDFVQVGSNIYGATGGNDTNFERSGAAWSVQNGTSTSDPPANRLQTPTFTATANLWLHALVFPQVATTTAAEQAIIIRSPDGVSRIVVRQTGTNGTLKVSTRNAAGTITDLATASGTFTAAAAVTLDFNVNYTCSGSGGVTLYLSGVQVINYSGNPCTDAATSLNQVDLASLTNGSGDATAPAALAGMRSLSPTLTREGCGCGR